MPFQEAAAMLVLSGFHTAITLLALFRARIAWKRSAQDEFCDRGTMWRLAFLRVVAVTVALSGGMLAIATPLLLASTLKLAFLPVTTASTGIILGGSWLLWIPSTIALDNLALRWLRRRPAARPHSAASSSAACDGIEVN